MCAMRHAFTSLVWGLGALFALLSASAFSLVADIVV